MADTPVFLPRDVGGGVLATPVPADAVQGTGRPRGDGKGPDFEVNLGRLISTLQVDYPKICFDPPEFEVYTDDIELLDPVSWLHFWKRRVLDLGYALSNF